MHIQDPGFYEVLYAQNRHSNKLKHLEHRFNNVMSAFASAEHHVHRVRRAALNPFFSKRKIAQHSPNIQHHMNRLARRVTEEFVGNGSVLNLNNMWGAFTSDIVVGYTLEKPYDFILEPDFRAAFSDAMYVLSPPSPGRKQKRQETTLTTPNKNRESLTDPVHFITQFPWMIKSLQKLPDWLVVLLSPPMRDVIAFNKEMEIQIIRAKKAAASPDYDKEKGDSGAPSSLFKALIEDPDLPPSEVTTRRLQHEAISVIGAGIETTMYTLSTCSYHLLANPPILAELQAELEAAIPNPAEIPHLDVLMQLPYLTAVVNEALRFGYGTPQRIPRECPSDFTYAASTLAASHAANAREYNLPKGYPVSMDHYTASHDTIVFAPDPHTFRPERWLGNPVAPDEKALSRYMIAFGRGTRSCVGMQLAYADLYIGLATFYRRFDCELYQTERDAVDLFMDLFVPRPKPGTKGVRVKVLGLRA